MKRAIGLALAAAVLVSATPAEAAKRRVNEAGSGSLWYGIATDTGITRSVGTPSISLLIKMGSKLFLQTYTNIQSTSPFNLGVGAAVKYNAVGSNSRGMHLVGGFGLGTTGAAETFFFNFLAGAGLHAEVVDGLLLSADTGLIVAVGGGTQVLLGGVAPQLGLSLHVEL